MSIALTKCPVFSRQKTRIYQLLSALPFLFLFAMVICFACVPVRARSDRGFPPGAAGVAAASRIIATDCGKKRKESGSASPLTVSANRAPSQGRRRKGETPPPCGVAGEAPRPSIKSRLPPPHRPRIPLRPGDASRSAQNARQPPSGAVVYAVEKREAVPENPHRVDRHDCCTADDALVPSRLLCGGRWACPGGVRHR